MHADRGRRRRDQSGSSPGRGRVLGLDGLEEAGFLEGGLPGFDALLDVGDPLGWAWPGRRRRRWA
ncbi:MAG: hypothetical protein MZU84_09225 [Sphingobacterium sp.]|nr:hypothetical protein [Sphingobacterium sp.]